MAYQPRRHRRSIRLAAYDYRNEGAYFVTICTHERALVFDNPATKRAVELALLSMGRYCRPASVDEFVVMPNHVHAIIRISTTDPVGAQHTSNRNDISPANRRLHTNERLTATCAAPLHADYLRAAPVRTRRVPPATWAAPLHAPRVTAGSLGAVVRAFKSTAAKRINAIRNTPGVPVWQRNYYEHVIRSDDDLARIRQYIRDNPAKWADDPDNPANIPDPGRSDVNPA